MAFRATVETLIYLDHFRNIDLYQQGYYYLRVSFYHDV